MRLRLLSLYWPLALQNICISTHVNVAGRCRTLSLPDASGDIDVDPDSEDLNPFQ